MSEELARSLVERALKGDRRAVRRLIRALTPVIQARVARALRRRGARGRDPRQEVEDFTQEVFVALLANDGRILRSWSPEKGLSLQNFAGLVAERQAASILRSGKRSPWTEDPTLDTELNRNFDVGPGGTEQRVASRQLFTLILERLRLELSPKGMHLFELLLIEQRSVVEVTTQTGMSADAIYAWRSRLKKLLRRLRAEVLSDPPRAERTP